MSITTLKNNNSLPISKIILYTVGVIGIFLVGYFAREVAKTAESLKGKAALVAESDNAEANVYINGTQVGKTPYKSLEVKPGENKIKLKTDTREYETSLDFIANNRNILHQVIVKRDLGVSDVFSSGVNVWMEKGRNNSVLRVVSDPNDALVYIDNTEQGRTPFSTDKISEGEYDLRIDAPGYQSQTFRINVKKGYTLNLDFKLFPVPTPNIPKAFEGSNNMFDLSLDNPTVTSDTQDWVRAVIYWNKNQGISLDGVGLNKELLFDYYLDYKGNVFDKNGAPIIDKAALDKLKDAKRSAYLGRATDGQGVTKDAKTALEAILGSSIGGKAATVKETGTGWLRVRDTAGLGGKELAKVNVGQSYDVVEQATGWVKIKVSDTIQGWVSADFVTVADKK